MKCFTPVRITLSHSRININEVLVEGIINFQKIKHNFLDIYTKLTLLINY